MSEREITSFFIRIIKVCDVMKNVKNKLSWGTLSIAWRRHIFLITLPRNII